MAETCSPGEILVIYIYIYIYSITTSTISCVVDGIIPVLGSLSSTLYSIHTASEGLTLISL
jgi:hypothetical protein